AGSVIHAMHHEQDMRNYGGLRQKIPLTFWAMLIGTLAITGVGIPLTTIGFAGFLSKDAIIESAFASGIGFAFWPLVIAALFTSFYSWRLMFLTFWGAPRGDRHAHEHAHESPPSMLVPLGALALGAVLSGMVWYGPFFGEHSKVNTFFGITQHETEAGERGTETADTHGETTAAATAESGSAHDDAAMATGMPPQGAIYMAPDNHVLTKAHESPTWVKLSPFVAMLIGLFAAYVFYIRRPDLPGKLAENQRPLYLFLLNKWYFDEVYDALIVRPTLRLGKILWKYGDGKVIDGFLNGVAMGLVPMVTRTYARLQSGYLFHYAFAMVIGVTVLITWITLRGGAG
ncbi:MAG TPA: NADH-quinone oxidoreductase subunit L, partial [Rhodobacteraceae bacterium]|nr:NADH-quinone oxidoreductase subunit L [Paracoccaceae bacterium]